MLAVAPDTSSVVHACPRCRGLFVPPLAWHVLLTQPERVTELEAKLPPAPPRREELIASVRCPSCRLEMDRVRFAATSGIIVDTCTAMHGSWLDAGELGAIVAFKERRDVGADAERQSVEQAAELRAEVERAAEVRRLALRAVERLSDAEELRREGDGPGPRWSITATLVSFLALAVVGALYGRCAHTPARPLGPSSTPPASTATGEIDRR